MQDVKGQPEAGMNLDEAQKKKVANWVAQGLKLSEIQKRLESEFGIRVAYIEVRLLIDDLKLTPKDPPPMPSEKQVITPSGAAAKVAAKGEERRQPPPDAAQPPKAGVSVRVDTVSRPGTLVSGQVTFSDNKAAEWYLDEAGRLGLVPKEQGYRPSATDLETFQTQLQDELQRLGL